MVSIFYVTIGFMVIVLEMGLITPPVGLNVFIIKGVAKDVTLRVIFVGVIPFSVATVMAIILIMIFPEGYTKWSRFFSNLYFAGACVVKKPPIGLKKH